MDVIIEAVAEDPDTHARDYLFARLGEDNRRKTGRSDKSDFAVLLRVGENAELVGGLWGADDFGWAFINYLYVPADMQGRGLGSRLLLAGEAIARQRGMIGAWVNTYDFQAREFYERLGFEVFGSLEARPGAAGQFFLRKLF